MWKFAVGETAATLVATPPLEEVRLLSSLEKSGQQYLRRANTQSDGTPRHLSCEFPYGSAQTYLREDTS